MLLVKICEIEIRDCNLGIPVDISVPIISRFKCRISRFWDNKKTKINKLFHTKKFLLTNELELHWQYFQILIYFLF